MDNVEEAIKEIAAKHGVVVSRNDPILMMLTMNARLMRDSESAQRKLVEKFAESLEEIADRWGNDAKNKAERTLNAALAASKEVMIRTAQEEAEAVAARISREMDTALRQLSVPVQNAKRVSLMNLVAALVTLCAAGLVLWASTH